MSQNQQNFEELIRQALENFEVDYNPAHWKEMESRLNLLASGVAVSMNSFYAAFVVAGLFMAGLVYFGLPDEKQKGLVATEEIIEEDDNSDGLGYAERKTRQLSHSSESGQTFVMEVPTSKLEPVSNNDVSNVTSSEDDENRSGSEDIQTDLARTKAKKGLVEYGEMKVKRIKSSVAQGCEGLPITFSSAGSETEGNYLWNFGDGYFSNNHSPVHVFDAPGIFDVSLLVTPLTGGKLTPLTVEDQIKINPRPRASFDFTYKSNELNIPQVKFENRTKNVEKVIWKIDDEVVSELNSPLQNFTRKGSYDVTLIAINEFGCADTTIKSVIIKEDYNLMAADEFRPNGDGRGETFMPRALQLIDGDFVMRIIDPRTDMVIFETNNFYQPWDGSINGTTVRASSGEYTWEVDVDFSNGMSDQFQGHVRLKK